VSPASQRTGESVVPTKLTEAERFLLNEIRQGRSAAWTQLVERYQGRLLAFARSKVRDPNEAEDLLQETFISFLRAIGGFREQASLETYLFSILRRKIIDSFRGRGLNLCLLQDSVSGGGEDASADASDGIPGPDPTASWYARRDEDLELKREALASALGELIDDYKRSLNFRDLEIVEMLFYCQLRNKDIAQLAGVNVNHVAVIKHRCLKQIRDHLQRLLPAARDVADLFSGGEGPVPEAADAMLGEIWQEQRLSCPKRSTIGAYLLGTLDPPWNEYVAFHLDRLGCRFCRANLDDLKRQSETGPTTTVRDRILESTVGFLRKP